MQRQILSPKAFTLIEVLIVLIVIGIIAAVLFPVFSRARANARRITCVSNLRQIGSAVTMYLQDSDDVFMPVASIKQEGAPIFWFQELQPYIRNLRILECPEDATKSWEEYKRSSYNSHLGGVWSPLSPSSKLNPSQKGLSQVVRPASAVLMVDSGTAPIGNFPPEQWPSVMPCPQDLGDAAVISSHTKPGSYQNGLLFAPRARHSGRTNVLWADGHVTTWAVSAFYVSPGVIAPGKTVPGYSPCLRPEAGCR